MIVIDWRKIGKLQFFFVLTKLMRSKGVMQYKHILKNNACTLFFLQKVNQYIAFEKEFKLYVSNWIQNDVNLDLNLVARMISEFM